MIGYVMFGTNDLEAGAAFYDKVFEPLGYKRCWVTADFITFGDDEFGQFSITKPFNGEPATVGNGTMVALQAPNKAAVDAVYAAAMAAGGNDEGGPGYRGDGEDGGDMKFYAAYFRDLDGNKLDVFCIGQ